jgi:hypothetical protein
MARRPNQLLLRLFYASLIILAAIHPNAVGRMAELGVGLLLAIVQGTADGAAANPGAAILTAGLVYIAYQIRTHQPRTARTHH